jgi:hypothetical protein
MKCLRAKPLAAMTRSKRRESITFRFPTAISLISGVFDSTLSRELQGRVVDGGNLQPIFRGWELREPKFVIHVNGRLGPGAAQAGTVLEQHNNWWIHRLSCLNRGSGGSSVSRSVRSGGASRFEPEIQSWK